MFEPVSQGSERPGPRVLMFSCGLWLRLRGDNVILFQAKDVQLSLSMMAGQNLNHNTI